MRIFIQLAMLSLFLAAGTANAEIFKCSDQNGKTTYSEAPCPSGASAKVIKIAPPPPGYVAPPPGYVAPVAPVATDWKQKEEEFKSRQQARIKAEADAEKKPASASASSSSKSASVPDCVPNKKVHCPSPDDANKK